jgi:hypothetical protein
LLAKERCGSCFDGTSAKPIFELIFLKWCVLGMLQKQKAPREEGRQRGGCDTGRRGGDGGIGRHCCGGKGEHTGRHYAMMKLNQEEEDRRAAGSGENDDDGKKWKMTWVLCTWRELNLIIVSGLSLYS